MSPSAVSTSSTLYVSPRRRSARARRRERRPNAPLAAFGELAADLLLDPLEDRTHGSARELEVVVEAVLDRRADGDLHARIEPPHRLGQQVRRRVAEDVQRVGIVAVARREDLDLAAVRERQPQILDVAVRAHEHGLLGELGPDRLRGIEPEAPSGSSSSDLSGRTTLISGVAARLERRLTRVGARCQWRSKYTAIQIDISNNRSKGSS